jgi:hypothetical protein
MPLSVGDAVLTFLGDTTQLDQAFARIPEQANASMSAAAASVGKVGDALEGVSFELDATASNAAYAGGEISTAMDKARGSVYEARGEAALLGEAFGIHLPRHVRSFLAEMPGVGKALSAAFSATAVFFLIEALIQGAEKLSNFIANTFIYTEAAKAAAAAEIALNQEFLKTAQAITKAKEALEDYGLTASQKTQKAIEAHTKSLADNTKEIEANKLKMAQLAKEQAESAAAEEKNVATLTRAGHIYTDAVKDNSQAIEDLKNKNALLMKGMEELRIEMQVLSLTLRDEEDVARKATLAKQEAFGQAQINGARTVGSAVLNLQKAQAVALIGLDSSTAGTRLLLDLHFAEAQYQLDLSTAQKTIAATQQAENQLYQITKANLENRLSVQKTMGAAGVEAVKATQVQIEELGKSHGLRLRTEQVRGNAEIEALEKGHETKLLNDATKFKEEFNQIIAAAFAPGTSRGLGAGLGPVIQELDQVDAAAKKLGVTLESSLAKSTGEAKKAVDILTLAYKHNLVTLDDLHRGELAHVQAELAEARASGQNTLALQREEAELKKLIPVVKDADHTHQGLQKIILKTDEAFNSFVSAMASGSESIGQAAKHMTEQMLQALAQWAAAKGAASLAQGFSDLGDPFTAPLAPAAFEGAALWFALAGASAAVEGAISGSGGGGGSGSHNAAGLSPGQTSSSGGGSNQTVSVTHLAEGGLITGPTRAIIGEKGTEAVIPLTNPDVMARLANALLLPSTLRIASAHSSDPAAISAASNARQGGFDDAAMAKLGEMIGAHLESSGRAGGDVYNFHNHIKGLLDSGTLVKTMDKMSKMVQQNRATLHSSNSFRVTRRSP